MPRSKASSDTRSANPTKHPNLKGGPKGITKADVYRTLDRLDAGDLNYLEIAYLKRQGFTPEPGNKPPDRLIVELLVPSPDNWLLVFLCRTASPRVLTLLNVLYLLRLDAPPVPQDYRLEKNRRDDLILLLLDAALPRFLEDGRVVAGARLGHKLTPKQATAAMQARDDLRWLQAERNRREDLTLGDARGAAFEAFRNDHGRDPQVAPAWFGGKADRILAERAGQDERFRAQLGSLTVDLPMEKKEAILRDWRRNISESLRTRQPNAPEGSGVDWQAWTDRLGGSAQSG